MERKLASIARINFLGVVLVVLIFSQFAIITKGVSSFNIEGEILDESDNGIEGIEITIINLDEPALDPIVVYTDNQGYYCADIFEEGWDLPVNIQVETTNAETIGYYDASIICKITESMIGQTNTIILIPVQQNPQPVNYYIDCGNYELTEDGSWSDQTQDSDFEDSDEKAVLSNFQKQIRPYFATTLDYDRANEYSHHYVCYIETCEIRYGLNSLHTNYATGGFTGTTEVSHVPYHIYTHDTGEKGMCSTAGYNIEVFLDYIGEEGEWCSDGGGCGAHGYTATFRIA